MLTEVGVIAVLLAAARVEAERQQVRVGVR